MSNHIYSIEEIRDIVHDVARQYGAERVWLFGSYARGEARPDSDTCVLTRAGLEDYFSFRVFI